MKLSTPVSHVHISAAQLLWPRVDRIVTGSAVARAQSDARYANLVNESIGGKADFDFVLKKKRL